MAINGKSTARLRRQLSGWNQLRRRSEKIAADLTLDISKLMPLFDEEIDALTQDLKQMETLWQKSPKDSTHALEIYKNIGTHLITARQLLDWSQRELARRCGLHPEAIHRYENTKYNRITLAKGVAIAEALLSGFAERDADRELDASKNLPAREASLDRGKNTFVRERDILLNCSVELQAKRNRRDGINEVGETGKHNRDSV